METIACQHNGIFKVVIPKEKS